MSLPDFEGRSVCRASVRITKAGDGLSDALQFAPVALHHADEVFFVLKGLVSQVNHRPAEKESEDLVRIHTIDAVEIAMVDEDDVAELLATNAARVAEAKEAARLAEEREAGIFTIGDAAAELLTKAHEDGQHAEALVEGCPTCDEERDLAAVGN